MELYILRCPFTVRYTSSGLTSCASRAPFFCTVPLASVLLGTDRDHVQRRRCFLCGRRITVHKQAASLVSVQYRNFVHCDGDATVSFTKSPAALSIMRTDIGELTCLERFHISLSPTPALLVVWFRDCLSDCTCGAVQVLKFLHENRSEGCSTLAVDFAAHNGHTEVRAVFASLSGIFLVFGGSKDVHRAPWFIAILQVEGWSKRLLCTGVNIFAVNHHRKATEACRSAMKVNHTCQS